MSLARLEAASQALTAIDPDAAAWLAGACRGMRRGLPVSLALGINGPAARRERDRWLRQAALLLHRPGETCWGVCGRLAARIGQTRHRDVISELLERANDAASVPESQRQLFNLLREAWPAEIAVDEISGQQGDDGLEPVQP